MSTLILGRCVKAGKSVINARSSGKPAMYNFSRLSMITNPKVPGNLEIADSANVRVKIAE
jgi:hypothetical protein